MRLLQNGRDQAHEEHHPLRGRHLEYAPWRFSINRRHQRPKALCALSNDRSQLKYYDSGVGTDGTPLDHLSGGAMGEGLFQKIQDCYDFLSNVYEPTNQIFVFG